MEEDTATDASDVDEYLTSCRQQGSSPSAKSFANFEATLKPVVKVHYID